MLLMVVLINVVMYTRISEADHSAVMSAHCPTLTFI